MNCIKYDYIKLLYYIKFYIQGSKGEREGGVGSTAFVGSCRCCLAVDVACWALAVVCHLWSSLCMVVDWAVDVFGAAGVV